MPRIRYSTQRRRPVVMGFRPFIRRHFIAQLICTAHTDLWHMVGLGLYDMALYLRVRSSERYMLDCIKSAIGWINIKIISFVFLYMSITGCYYVIRSCLSSYCNVISGVPQNTQPGHPLLLGPAIAQCVVSDAQVVTSSIELYGCEKRLTDGRTDRRTERTTTAHSVAW